MAEFSRFGITEPLSSGVDFYTGDEQVPQVTVSAEGNLVINITKLALATSTPSIESNTTTSITKFAYAAANISDILSATAVVGTERHDALVSISAESNVVITITKIAFGVSSTSVESNSTIVGTKIAFAATAISIDSNVTTSSLKLAHAAAQLSGETTVTKTATKIALAAAVFSVQASVTTGAKISLATIRINILNNTDITAKTIRFSNAITSDTTLIRTLLLLDNKPITNQSRQLQISATPIFIENKNWAGDLSRYYKNSSNNAGAKRSYSLDWQYIPGKSQDTVDLREARNYLKDLSADADAHTLTIINQDENGTTPYTEENITVFITNYTENLLRRYLEDDVYLYQCSMTLEEA